MSILFESTQINGMTLRNRFVRSATWEGMAAEDGSCTPQLLELTTHLAAGEIGLIIASYAYVLAEGKTRIGQLGIYQDEHIAGYRQMAEAAHRHGSRIVAQIVHAGILSDPELTGQVPQAPSHVPDLMETAHEEMSVAYIHRINDAFGQAARRAKEAGFDGVQIHAAHGYLHSQFVSPAFNRRRDAYGGDAAHRARAVLEVLESVRSAVGEDFPVLIKMNCEDFMDGGLTLSDSLAIGELLQQNGIDAIELSGGTLLSGDLGPVRKGITAEKNEAYFQEHAKAFKGNLSVPLILVGGIRSFEKAEQLIQHRCADYISLCRPFVREPDLVKRWARGDRSPAKCASDSLCREAAFSGEGIYCVLERKAER